VPFAPTWLGADVIETKIDLVLARAGVQRPAVPAMEPAIKLTIAGKPFVELVATRSPFLIPIEATAAAISVT